MKPFPVAFLAILLALTARAQSSDSSAGLDVLKQMSIEDLMQTSVTSVSKYPEKLLDAAAAIQVISNEDIVRSGFSTIADALRMADNLDVAQKDPHDWAISARGFNANLGDKLLVLMDGRSVYTPIFSGVFWNAQDYLLEDLDRIEVVSGPGGTLWGANAVNGVINIVSKSARDTVGMYSEVGGGTDPEFLAGWRYGAALAPNVFFRVYGKYSSYGNSLLSDGAEGDDYWHQGQTGFRLDAGPNPDNALTVQGDVYSGDEAVQSGGLARIAGFNLLGHWTHHLADDSEVSATAYFDRTHLQDPFAATSFQPAGDLLDDVDTYNIDLQHRFTLQQRQTIIWGAGFRLIYDDVDQEAPNLGFFPPNFNQRLYNLFAQDEIELAPRWFLTAGSKLEHNAFTGWEVEPNIRLRRELGGQQTLWAAVSRAVRTPSRFDRDLAEPSIPPVLIEGSNNFQSETLVAEELGYRAQLNKQASFSASFFYNQYDHLRGLGSTPVTVLPLYYNNSLYGDTYGAELAGNYQILDNWTLHVGYTHLNEDLRVKTGQIDVEDALAETADPKNQFSVRSSVDLPGQVELNGMWRYVAALPTNNFATPGTVPGYYELDLRLGWRPSRAWEFSLTGRNLLHAAHAEYGFPSPTDEEIRRGFYAKAAWHY